MDSREVIARFNAERQTLALMDHANIARVLEAGTTDNDRPYFVMELVRGKSITEYCDLQRFTTRERLKLLLPICQAVQHAHQKGIIHRDLKPSNILVTAQGEPSEQIALPGTYGALFVTPAWILCQERWTKAALLVRRSDGELFRHFTSTFGQCAALAPSGDELWWLDPGGPRLDRYRLPQD